MPVDTSTVDSPDELDLAAAGFASLRPRLFAVAYRILGNRADAEDAIQEVWLHWQCVDRQAIREPVAFLVTATSHVAINEIHSAHKRREIYVGPWPVPPVDPTNDPEVHAERTEALELALQLLLDRLSPSERAAFVLREAFDYPYHEIAAVIQATEISSRQLVSRAHRHLGAERRTNNGHGEYEQLLAAFRTAARTGDTSDLEELFTPNDATDATNRYCA